MLSVLLVSIGLLVFVSLIVFGGGQVFMPLFQFYWNLLRDVFKIEVDQNLIDAAFSVGNGTPGVLSTKFAFISGYFIEQHEWWGVALSFLTYFSFIIPAMLVMYLAMRLSVKYKENKFGLLMSKYFKPVVAGIMIALVIQIMIATAIPLLHFNSDNILINKEYGYLKETPKSEFFSGYRLWILIPWCIVSCGYSFYLYKKKFPIYALILLNILIAILIFHPFV
ncbi:Chromate transporter [Mycoplasmopsis californica]|uniref:Chromate transporter n=1 Tax=Mycoplasmopsis equigenitalium TaxID=114883 RepID=A0ABY5J181_9BACT|nr:chromate transporter [Mycoplasmopsis equigenitalium]UUD36979.1 chromate transporter [Mycoplasmopsis equigenitalium]VEU69725.1 Chromate transporter [Mycoplasmopsis californica]